LTSGRVDKWDLILNWNVVKALNVCCYYKDKQDEERQMMLEARQRNR